MNNKPYSDIYWFKEYMATSSAEFRRKLIRKGVLTEKCSQCELTEWQGYPVPLHLDHIDGNRLNNTLSNLRVLCPNCHALTDTYGGRNRSVIKREDMIAAYDKYVKENGTPRQRIGCTYF